MAEPEVDPADYESFEVTIPVRINFDPNRGANRMSMRVADCETEVTDESGKRLGAAGGAMGGDIYVSVGRYAVFGRASDLWKAVRAKLEELKPDLWESDGEAP